MKKVILITGASSGMGHETAKKLLEQGHIVYAAARRIEKMKDLEALGAKVIAMDVTKYETLSNTIDQIIEEQGKIDVLWNNAGFGLYGSVEETSIEDAKYQFEVNLFGIAKLTQLVVPHMRNQKSGLIINTSSMGGKVYFPMGAWYHATKHALEGWSDCLRIELKQFGINVVILEPGAIKTEFGDVMFQPMFERSGNGPYKEIVQKFVKVGEEMNKNPNSASSPSVIADTIVKIVNSENPKSRYLVGKYAKPMVMARKWLGDGIYEKMLNNMIK